MKFGVVNFPGSTGFSDTVYALQYILEQEAVQIWHENVTLPQVDVVVLPSGASFGDDPQPGVKAAQSPVMGAIKRFAENNGLVLGVGNGFQILCHAHLLNGELTENQSRTFVGKNIFVRSGNSSTPITRLIGKSQLLQLPIAHAFGRYQADAETMRELHQNGQILLRYCNDDGTITALANPDGSTDNIAAICNKSMNVFGMMACIERAVDPDLGNVNGMVLLQSLIADA
ncbi:MAG: phosphoribosylformylglycinamidine synthase subunit PurQ [Bacteroidales bacterium]|jgi:phosphoribosylformylglycinamidine synthase|nr:phosphoribosylformylglycinamidine synthase subunit PurQ [Bacteroidales bacterium]